MCSLARDFSPSMEGEVEKGLYKRCDPASGFRTKTSDLRPSDSIQHRWQVGSTRDLSACALPPRPKSIWVKRTCYQYLNRAGFACVNRDSTTSGGLNDNFRTRQARII